MDRKTVLVLGGGWGGLAVAHRLRGILSAQHRIVVVERQNTFSLCLSNLWVMTGERKHPADVERQMSKLAHKEIQWVHAEVHRIDPVTRSVDTSEGVLQGDYLVIALGAELSPQSVPGFAESAYNLYEHRGAFDLQSALSTFEGGKIAVLISRTPFRCPPAPYEAAFLVETLLREKDLRNKSEVAIYTPEKQPMPVAGPEVGEALRRMLADKGINYYPEHTVSRIDAASHKMFFNGKEASYDLLIGVPPHKAPQPIVEAGLTDSTGYVPTHPQTLRILSDPETLETRYPNVFAIGDVTAIRLMNRMLLPKAGVFAEGQARVVAENIASAIEGGESRADFDGKGLCYVETGDGMAAFGSGSFYAYPAPRVTLEQPSPRYRKDKEEYERVLETWFEK